MIKPSFAVAALLSSVSLAMAQGTSAPPRLQVNVQFNRALGPSLTAKEQVANQEELRRSLYELAAKECEIVKQVFKADCRISLVNVQSSASRGQPGQESTSASMSATYELAPPAKSP